MLEKEDKASSKRHIYLYLSKGVSKSGLASTPFERQVELPVLDVLHLCKV
jgi:hypothetical protein